MSLMVTKRQIQALEKKLQIYNQRAVILEKVDGVLFDSNGQKLTDQRLTELDQGNNIIIIDDIN